ncbi:MAG TPA: glycosyltransferase family 2 protein, partial [Abditibacteriaceae bacterium]|nr:glycosyltransferase family 2 protein [Abditibacteriaceae bacterium]
MRISVVVPVHNAANDLQQCLRALATSTRLPDEVVVVDDASTDNSSQAAQQFASSLSMQGLTTGNQARGPAFARNRGAEAATGDIVLFLDADVRVHPDSLTRIEQCFDGEPSVAALFGSYDHAPPAPNLVSGYVNLRHHWTHQHASREAWTFWSGIGAIRRAVFWEMGGFDESYARPSIEDIALGRKLRLAGHRVLLCPDAQGTHLKRWTVRSWLRTDIRDRAIPWTRLMLSDQSDVPSDLNLDWKSRVSALIAWLAFALFVVALISSQKTSLLMLCGAAFVALAALNWPLLQFFFKRRGVPFALGAFCCHTLYFLYSSATFGILALSAKLQSVFSKPRHRVLVLLLAALFKGL